MMYNATTTRTSRPRPRGPVARCFNSRGSGSSTYWRPCTRAPRASLDWRPGTQSDYGIAYSVHNQGSVLRQTLGSLVQQTMGAWEIAVILDSCVDGSSAAVLDTLALRPGDECRRGASLLRAVVYSSRTPLFETAAENIALWMMEPAAAPPSGSERYTSDAWSLRECDRMAGQPLSRREAPRVPQVAKMRRPGAECCEGEGVWWPAPPAVGRRGPWVIGY